MVIGQMVEGHLLPKTKDLFINVVSFFLSVFIAL